MKYDIIDLTTIDHIKGHSPNFKRNKGTLLENMGHALASIDHHYSPKNQDEALAFVDLLTNMSDDLRWKNKGKQTVFISEPVARDLLNSIAVFDKFASDGFAYTLPFEDFQIVLPKNFTMPDGTVVPSFFVSKHTLEQAVSEQQSLLSMAIQCSNKIKTESWLPPSPFLSGLSETFDETEYDDYTKQPSIQMRYIHPDQSESTAIGYRLGFNEIPELMKVSTHTEFHENMGFTHAVDRKLITKHSAVCFYMSRLVLSLSLFHNATNGKYLFKGIPKDAGNMGLKAKKVNFNPHSAMSIGAPSKSEFGNRASHVRGWHYRNLRADRYYQGEHAEKPKGSRWILIPPCVVTGSTGALSPHTQTKR